MAGKKRILVEVDANQWAALKGQAATEGRFVRVLLGEAIGDYLVQRARRNGLVAAVAEPSPAQSMELLKALVASVPADSRLHVWDPHSKVHHAVADAEPRTETARQRLEREAAAREWLRTHPEEEGQ